MNDDPRTVPEGTPAPDRSGIFTELCPHCDEPYAREDMEQHVTQGHADLPECTARVDSVHGTYTCAFRAGHAKGHGEYGEWHASTYRDPIGRTVWNYTAQGATPHRGKLATADGQRRALTLNCSTCGATGITTWEDHVNVCPGFGEVQFTRRLGHGLTVDTAPARARMALTVLADAKWGAVMQGADCINIADQVLYQVVGYDAETAALLLELVEDWRPAPTAKLTEAEADEIRSRWLEQYGKPGTAHPVEIIEEQP